MTLFEIMLFLIPNDPFQWFFLIVIIFLAGINVWQVRIKANESSWQIKWENGQKGQQDDDLDSSHGSVIEISQAVATGPEKLAEIMPGLLLIIGLLGTFVGLGIALNKASDIISGAKTEGMELAMSNMMEMMHGLGTKFKTSTWGIIGFLSFKAWVSVDNFEERRLRWTISTMKLETDRRRSLRAQVEESRFITLQQQKTELNEKLINAIKESNSSLQGFWDNKHKNNEKQRAELNKILVSSISDANTSISELLNRSFENFEKQQAKLNNAIINTIRELNLSIEGQLNRNLNQLMEIGNKIIPLIDESNLLSNGLLSSMENLKEISLLNGKTETEISYRIGKVEEAVSGLRTNINEFIAANAKGLKSLENSGTLMGNASEKMSDSAVALNKEINSFSVLVSDVLNGIKDDLGSTIKMMNDDFVKNLITVSTDLSDSTKTISQAVDKMSGEIEKTLNSMGVSISKAVEEQKISLTEANRLQNKAFSTFQTTSLTLSENIQKITGEMDKVMSRIEQGLTAVSDKRQEMKQASDILKRSLESVNLSKDTLESYVKTEQLKKQVSNEFLSEIKKINRNLEHFGKNNGHSK